LGEGQFRIGEVDTAGINDVEDINCFFDGSPNRNGLLDELSVQNSMDCFEIVMWIRSSRSSLTSSPLFSRALTILRSPNLALKNIGQVDPRGYSPSGFFVVLKL
jgi:hypothetical protein